MSVDLEDNVPHCACFYESAYAMMSFLFVFFSNLCINVFIAYSNNYCVDPHNYSTSEGTCFLGGCYPSLDWSLKPMKGLVLLAVQVIRQYIFSSLLQKKKKKDV